MLMISFVTSGACAIRWYRVPSRSSESGRPGPSTKRLGEGAPPLIG